MSQNSKSLYRSVAQILAGKEFENIAEMFSAIGSDLDTLSYKELSKIIMTRGRQAENHVPSSVIAFFAQFMRDLDFEDVLCPWLNNGLTIRGLAEEGAEWTSFRGFHRNETVVNAAKMVAPANTDLSVGDFITADPLSDNDTFDLIIGVPPFGLREKNVEVDGHKFHQNTGNAVIARALTHLREDGVALFIVTPGIYWARNQHPFLNFLKERKLYIDASFHLPAGTFRPITGIPAEVLVLRRGDWSKTLFVGEVAGEERNRELLKNYWTRHSDKSDSRLGATVEYESYKGLQQLISLQQVEKLASRLPYNSQRLGDLATEIHQLKQSETKDNKKWSPNTLYLHLAVSEGITTDPGDLSGNGLHYSAVTIDPSLADARVVAGFLRSPLGKEILSSLSRGSVFPQISPSAVADIPIWLPDIDRQKDIIELDQRLKSIEDDATSLRERLWRRTDKAAKFATIAARINHEDTFPSWLDTLPFPLASVLWTYHTLKGHQLRRYTQLEFFFEALAQFMATLLLSVVKRDEALFSIEWEVLQAALQRNSLSLEKSSFGTWKIILERLSKTLRKERSAGTDQREFWANRFACENEELIDALISKKLVEIVSKANKLRNDWRGHGGMTGDAEAERRESVLLDLLNNFRQLIGRRWEDYPLVSSVSNNYRAGEHHLSNRRLMGVKYPFEQQEMISSKPMDDRFLHFAAPIRGELCPLLPLVKMGTAPKPENQACYFFNRREADDKLRYVSFHYENKPEIMEEQPLALALLEELAAFT